MKSISTGALKQQLDRGERPVLLDVREPWEFEICRIDGSWNVPPAGLPAALEQLDHNTEIIVICHHGVRSLQVAVYLENLGYRNMVNLDRGVDGWALTVEPDMTRY